jgi:hypothetical protein
MSGGLNLSNTTIANQYSAELILDKPTQSSGSNVWGFTTGSPRWCVALGNNSYESGSNAGSHFEVERYDDSGNHIDSPLYIDRPSGTTQILNNLVIYSNYLGTPSSGDGSAQLSLQKALDSQPNRISGYRGGELRWTIDLGDGTPDTGDAGTDFVITRYLQSGGGYPADFPLKIIRASGDVLVNHDPTQPLGVVTKQYVDSIFGSIGSGGYVARSGDTMTGPLRIFEPGPSSDLILDSSSGLGTSNNITGQTLGVARWTLAIGNHIDETGGNAGSDFELSRHDDAGGYLDSPLYIERARGYTTISCLTVGPESTNGFLTLNKSTGSSTLRGASLGVGRWDVYLGDNTQKTGGNVGSDFGITRFADDGNPIKKVLQISRVSCSTAIVPYYKHYLRS